MDNKGYYQMLSVNQTASAEEIKRAYRKLAMQYHPDRNRDREEWANQKFKEINEAFHVLSDPEKRRRYDNGTLESLGDIFGGQDSGISLDDLFNDFGDDFAEPDMFDSLFGNGIRGRRARFRASARGSDRSRKTMYETQTGIDLENLFSRDVSTNPLNVNYEIILSRDQAARGTEKELVRHGKHFKVTIPAGVRTGAKIRLKNALETTDGRPGDIIVTVKVGGDER
jgi:curved DNA-binding protein